MKFIRFSIPTSICHITFIILISLTTLAPTSAHASAVNCDYRTWYGFISGDKGSYAQCINVRGSSDRVSKISISFTGYVWTTFGPGISIPPIPNVDNICDSKMQVEWHLQNQSSPSTKTYTYGCHRPLVDESHDKELNFSYALFLRDRSQVCMRYKSTEFNGNRWTPKTCITIKK